MDELAWLSISELAPLIQRRAVSPVAVTRAVLDRIDNFNDVLGTFVTVLAERAMEAADMAERQLGDGQYLGPLHGITVSIKDNIDVQGVRTTACSRAFADNVAAADADVVALMRAKGAVVVGKTRMWELAMRVEATPPPILVRNPWDLARAPMGSTSGGAAGLAAALCHVAVGTDTGGSLRGPAAACGVVGLKPSLGYWSRAGVLPVSKTLDCVGPLTRTVADCALVVGLDGAPATLSGLRVGTLGHDLDNAEGEIASNYRDVCAALWDAGAIRVPFAFEGLERAAEAQTIINEAESAQAHGRLLRDLRQLLGDSVRDRLERGLRIPRGAYENALQERLRFQRDFATSLSGIDVVITPTSPAAAPLLSEAYGRSPTPPTNVFRWPFSLLGAPALSVPCGFTGDGLPIGLQIAALPGKDDLVLSVARAWEDLNNLSCRRPPMF